MNPSYAAPNHFKQFSEMYKTKLSPTSHIGKVLTSLLISLQAGILLVYLVKCLVLAWTLSDSIRCLLQLQLNWKTYLWIELDKFFDFLNLSFIWWRQRCVAGKHLWSHHMYTCCCKISKVKSIWMEKIGKISKVKLLLWPNSFCTKKGNNNCWYKSELNKGRKKVHLYISKHHLWKAYPAFRPYLNSISRLQATRVSAKFCN